MCEITLVTLSMLKNGPSVVAGCFFCPVFQHDSEKQRALLREEKGDGMSGRVYFLSSKAKIEIKKRHVWIAASCCHPLDFQPSHHSVRDGSALIPQFVKTRSGKVGRLC